MSRNDSEYHFNRRSTGCAEICAWFRLRLPFSACGPDPPFPLAFGTTNSGVESRIGDKDGDFERHPLSIVRRAWNEIIPYTIPTDQNQDKLIRVLDLFWNYLFPFPVQVHFFLWLLKFQILALSPEPATEMATWGGVHWLESEKNVSLFSHSACHFHRPTSVSDLF